MIKIFPLLLFLLPFIGYGQNEFYNTGSAVYIQQGALLHIQGSLTNTADAVYGATDTFTNNGIIEIDGDFNAATGSTFKTDLSATSTDRAVKFTGLGTQFIKGTGTATFYNLVLDKQSATDSVVMQTNAIVTGSVIFNTASSYPALYGGGVTSSTYSPSLTTGITNNGVGGLLLTYSGSTEYLLDIQNANTDAIYGYAPLSINAAPSTGFILTTGKAGTSSGGVQRAVSSASASSYVFPFGTVSHGYNAVKLNFHNTPTGSINQVKGKFCNVETTTNGTYVGTIPQSCVGCDSATFPSPDNSGFNYYFAHDPCYANHPQWFILDNHAISNHGYWSFNAANNSSAYQYDMEVFPNTYTAVGGQALTGETWRVLKYDPSPDVFGADVSAADWSSQILSQVSAPSDLLTYSLNTACYIGAGIPGGVYSGFSDFTMDRSNSSNALPVTLISLEAYAVNNTFIQVQWVTALEINNKGFTVQRSTDGLNFSPIGWVDGHNNSTVTNTYTYNDNNVVPDVVYYYRLIQQDNNGNTNTTDKVQAALTGSTVFVVGDPFPNPSTAHSALNITTSLAQSVNIKLFDIIGQQLSTKDYDLTTGTNAINFNTGTLAGGTYTAIITAGNTFYSRKLVVAK